MSNAKDVPGTAAASPVASMALGAAIIAGALLAGSFMVMSAIDRAGARLDAINAGLADARRAAQSGVQPGAQRQAQAPPSNMPPGPDPNRRYTLNTAGAPVLGPKQARVKIVEFSDFQCPFCSRAVATLRRIHADYPKDVQIIWKNFPLAMHAKAQAAHAAAGAADRQGKFWEMYDFLFDNQKEFEPDQSEKYAARLGLDVGRFKADSASAEVRARVDADEKEGEALGINGAPAFFINGRFLYGAQPYEAFKKMVDEELAQK